MPVLKFTELSLQSLKAEKQTRYIDSALSGFGIIVGKRRKTFFVMHGQDRRIKTLGQYPKVALKAARQAALAIIDGVDTIGTSQNPEKRLVEYLRQMDASPRYKYEQERLLRRYLLSKTSDLTEVTKAQVLKATDALSGKPSEQLHAFRAIRAFLNWLARRDYIKTNPIANLEAPGSDKARDNVLTDAQLKEAWHKAEHLGAHGHVIRLCMLLGTRKGETSTIQPEWVTENLQLPPEVTKNRRTHLLPLSQCTTSHARALANGPKPNWNSWNRIKNNAGLTWLRLHDLRRTLSTTLAMLGTPPHIIERILNHVSNGEITPLAQIYNRYKYLPEIREALKLYEKHLEKIIGEPLS